MSLRWGIVLVITMTHGAAKYAGDTKFPRVNAIASLLFVVAVNRDRKVDMSKYRWHVGWIVLAALVVAGCAAVTPGSAESTRTIVEVEDGGASFAMRDLHVGLSAPLSLVYGPDDYLWVTERVGKRVVRVNPVDGAAQVALEIAEAYQRSSQDGVLGLVLHPQLLQGTGNDYVYLAYVYAGEGGMFQADRRVKIVRYHYDATSESLIEPLELLRDLPGSGDHNSGKLLIGADEKLYYTLGDQGNNQFGNACWPILAQVMPSAEEIRQEDWTHYQGKVLRMNLDGSIPDDNPVIDGVQSHIFTYGHRNVQGIVMGPNGLLYGTEQGPKTDDEVNLLAAGKNYGWPHVAGYQDDKAYVYGNWSAAADCATLEFSDFAIPPSVPQAEESAWNHPDFVEPLLTFGTVANDYNFQRTECSPQEWICWPTIAPTGVAFYAASDAGIPGWGNSLLITALKTGSVYRLELAADGRSVVGEPMPLFATVNRYRDVVIGPDSRTFYVISDSANWTLGADGLPTNQLENPGTILEFIYVDEE